MIVTKEKLQTVDELREQHGIKVKDFARKIGINPKSWPRIVRTGRASSKTIEQIRKKYRWSRVILDFSLPNELPEVNNKVNNQSLIGRLKGFIGL
jgi:transcriptional regulator with XRE-family HTH domain